MATSVLMAATADHHQATNPSLQDDHGHNHDQNGHRPIRRSSGRRKIKGCDSGQKKMNKTPQRGMGVEKLERLRLQEGWKKMTTETTNSAINPAVNPVSSFPDPILKVSGFGAPNQNPNNGAYLGFQYGQMDLSSFVGKNNYNYVSGNLFSSNTNGVKCYSQHCNACHKKKRFNGGGDCGFLGLNNINGDLYHQNIIINQQENHDQGLNVGRKMAAVGNISKLQGGRVEIVAVHKKGGSCSSSSPEGAGAGHHHVMMEYEFFPPSCKTEISSSDDQLVMMKNLQGEASSSSSSSMAPPAPGFASNSCLDLSLKLSYYN